MPGRPANFGKNRSGTRGEKKANEGPDRKAEIQPRMQMPGTKRAAEGKKRALTLNCPPLTAARRAGDGGAVSSPQNRAHDVQSKHESLRRRRLVYNAAPQRH